MSVWEIVIGVVLLLASVFIIIVVMLQESKQTGLGAISGDSSSDSFLSKGGNRTKEARLKFLTKVAAFFFIGLALTANILYKFLTK